MTSPTACTPVPIPSRARFATAVSVGQNSQRLTRSARTRLISSGIGSKRAQARLHMRDRNVELGRGNRAGQRRVCVAVNKHGIGLFLEHNTLKRNNHAAGHFAVRAAMDAERMVGLRNAELLEKNIGHVRDRSAARCGPDTSIRSSCSAMARDSGAALMNCGRAPTIDRIFLPKCFPCRPDDRAISGVGPHFRNELSVLQHAPQNRAAVFTGPIDGAPQTVVMINTRRKPQLITRFRRIAEAVTRNGPNRAPV